MLKINLKKTLISTLTPLFTLSFSAAAYSSSANRNIQKFDPFHTFTNDFPAELALAKTNRWKVQP
jgi:hypothetical protein